MLFKIILNIEDRYLLDKTSTSTNTHRQSLPSRQVGLQNTLTAPLQKGKTPPQWVFWI